jgi:hypothetical protein
LKFSYQPVLETEMCATRERKRRKPQQRKGRPTPGTRKEPALRARQSYDRRECDQRCGHTLRTSESKPAVCGAARPHHVECHGQPFRSVLLRGR